MRVTLGRAAKNNVPWAKAFLTLTGADHIPPFNGSSDRSAAVVNAPTTDFLRWIANHDLSP